MRGLTDEERAALTDAEVLFPRELNERLARRGLLKLAWVKFSEDGQSCRRHWSPTAAGHLALRLDAAARSTVSA